MISNINNNSIFTYIQSNFIKQNKIEIFNEKQNYINPIISNYNNEKNKYYEQLDNITNELSQVIYDDKKFKLNENITESFNDIKQLINSYNHTLNFFNQNKDLSIQNNNIYNSLKEITYPPIIYESIGINVDSSGKLQINKNELENAINNTPTKVNNILIGLISQTDNQLCIIDSQYNKLFPEISTMLGYEMHATSFYTSGAYLRVAAYINLGNIVNFYL